MKLRIDADPGELEHKAFALVLELCKKLEPHDARLGNFILLARQLEGEPLAKSASAARRVPTERRTFAGLPIVIEFPAGSLRNGRIMSCDYGYIEDTRGADGDGLDCFLGTCEDAPFAFVVHQRIPDDPTRELYDEDKVFLGFHDAHTAESAYLDHYPEEFLGAMTQVPVHELVARLGLDGMVKAAVARRFVLKSLDPQLAVDPMVGNRAVTTGMYGANLAVGAPPRPVSPPSASLSPSPESMRAALDQAASLFDVSAGIHRDPRIYQLRDIEQRNLHPVSEWETRLVPNHIAVDQKESNLAYIEDQLARRQWAGNAPTQLHPRDPRPALVISAEKAASSFASGLASAKGPGPSDSAPAPELEVGGISTSTSTSTSATEDESTWTVPTPKRSVSVSKAGLGEITLHTYADGQFCVVGAGPAVWFESLSAACDHVWVMQKGYSCASSWKKATGKRKVPSGAGWRFWGVDPKEMT